MHIEENDQLEISDTFKGCNCGEEIQYSDIQKLGNDLFLILKQINYYFILNLPKDNNFFTNINEHEIIINVFQSDFVCTICTLIPRCLDFIHICTPTLKNFGILLS
jgi:hypothetical protein